MGKGKNPFSIGAALNSISQNENRPDDELKKALGITPTNRQGESPDEYIKRKIDRYKDGYKKY